VRCLASCHQRLLARTLLVVAEEARLRDSMPTRCGSMYLSVVCVCWTECVGVVSFVRFCFSFDHRLSSLSGLFSVASPMYFIRVTLSAADPSPCIALVAQRPGHCQPWERRTAVGLPCALPGIFTLAVDTRAAQQHAQKGLHAKRLGVLASEAKAPSWHVQPAERHGTYLTRVRLLVSNWDPCLSLNPTSSNTIPSPPLHPSLLPFLKATTSRSVSTA
jgi:hypothetical protein